MGAPDLARTMSRTDSLRARLGIAALLLFALAAVSYLVPFTPAWREGSWWDQLLGDDVSGLVRSVGGTDSPDDALDRSEIGVEVTNDGDADVVARCTAVVHLDDGDVEVVKEISVPARDTRRYVQFIQRGSGSISADVECDAA